ILNAAGKTVDGGTLELLTLTPGGESGEPDLVLARLQAGTLPAGNYLLEVRLGNESKPVQAATARTFAVAAGGRGEQWRGATWRLSRCRCVRGRSWRLERRNGGPPRSGPRSR